MTELFGTILILGLFALGTYSLRVYRSKPWLPSYVNWKISNTIASKSVPSPLHIMFLFVDHFEPWEDTTDLKKARSRIETWVTNYPTMALKHRDADGVVPQHTWFYLVEGWQWKQYDAEFLRKLGALSYDGFGEIEFHLHHGAPQRIFPGVNTSEKLQTLIEEMKDFFSQTGALITSEEVPKQRYGFIHGKWALDNAMNGSYCGVDNELEVLSRTGCYADFTMPSGIESQSKKINCIYYPTGNPNCPKSYDQGVDVQVGGQNNGNLMIFSGMIDIYFRNIFLSGSTVEKSNIDQYDIPTRLRIDRWIKSNIHVKDRPQWIFVKVHNHGAREQDFNVSFGNLADQMYTYLEEKYNDGKRYKLHYVTAREGYNIVKAAEAGENGDPSLFRDYLIKPHVNTKIKSNVLYDLLSYRDENFEIKVHPNGSKTRFDFKDSMLKGIEGDAVEFLRYSSVKESSSIMLNLTGNGKVNIEITLPIINKKNGIGVKNAVVIGKKVDKEGHHYQLETGLEANRETSIEIKY